MTKFDPTRQKTYGPFWNHFSTTPRKFQSTSMILRKIKRHLKKVFPYSLKFQSNKANQNNYEMFNSFQTDTDILAHRNSLLSENIIEFLESFKLNFSKKMSPII